MTKSLNIPLQFFAEGAPNTPPEPEPAAPQIDYEKLAGIVEGKQRVAEDTVLKNYFKQQGLSADQMTQAITAFKEQQKANTPDVQAIQLENQQLKSQILQSQIQAEAMAQAAAMNVAPETVPYLLRLADLSKVTDDKGTVSKDAVASALNQVLTDLPVLKNQSGDGARGFVPVGADGNHPQTDAQEDETRRRFGLAPKKK